MNDRLYEAERLAKLLSVEHDDSQECKDCGCAYDIRDGCGPSVLCDSCAQTAVLYMPVLLDEIARLRELVAKLVTTNGVCPHCGCSSIPGTTGTPSVPSRPALPLFVSLFR